MICQVYYCHYFFFVVRELRGIGRVWGLDRKAGVAAAGSRDFLALAANRAARRASGVGGDDDASGNDVGVRMMRGSRREA